MKGKAALFIWQPGAHAAWLDQAPMTPTLAIQYPCETGGNSQRAPSPLQCLLSFTRTDMNGVSECSVNVGLRVSHAKRKPMIGRLVPGCRMQRYAGTDKAEKHEYETTIPRPIKIAVGTWHLPSRRYVSDRVNQSLSLSSGAWQRVGGS